MYDTYQNCPRLSDKLMEECGSRRLAQRQELDDGAEDDDAKTAKFEGDVLKVLKSLPNATTAPVCEVRGSKYSAVRVAPQPAGILVASRLVSGRKM